MENYNSLSSLLSVPFAAFLLSWVMPKAVQRLYAIFGSVVILALSIFVVAQTGGLAVEDKLHWVPEIGLSLSLRLDSISSWFVVLNGLVAVIAFSLRGSWYRKYPRLFTSLGFFLVFALNAAFLSADIILFYLAYEAVFIPMIFMVGMWGTNAKAASVFRFFLMSFLGSVLMLVSMFFLIWLHKEHTGHYSSNLTELIQMTGSKADFGGKWCYLGFFLAFAIKVPLVPFHGWLKDVYVNAPMPATIWMSAILSKLGVFGFIRFANPLFMDTAVHYQSWCLLISAISIVYAAMLAIRSTDPKELLAYSSISHLGFVMLGVFSLTPEGRSAAILLCSGHALVSALLFYVLHLVHERKGNLDLAQSHGLARIYPALFTVLFVAALASVSLPGTLNFAGEFLVLMQSYSANTLSTCIGVLGVVFGAVYMLKFFQQLAFGGTGGPAEGTAKDLSGYDLVVLLFLVALIVYFGFQPTLFLKGN